MRAVLINKTDELGHHGCTLVNRQIDLLADEAGIEIASKLPLHSDWDALAPSDIDAVIVNGEGTLHSSSKGAQRIAEVPKWAKERNIPAHLINSVYQNNSAGIAAKIAEFTSICVRDERSMDELAGKGIAAEVIPDLSLTWETEPALCAGRVIINGSTIKERRKELYALSSRDRPYLPILACPIDAPDRLRKLRFKRALSSIAPYGLLQDRYRNAIMKFDDFAAYLRANASGIITGRFHMATIALCLEIPVVAVSSNTHKIEAMFSSLDMMHRVTSTIRGATDLLEPYSADEIAAIRSLRQQTRLKAHTLFNRIKNHATGSDRSIADRKAGGNRPDLRVA